MTGFWKTDCSWPSYISHTHTLSIHCCNTRLNCLVCFSRVDSPDHVKRCEATTETMGPMEGTSWPGCMGLIFTPVLVRRLIGPPGLSRHFFSGLTATPNSPIGWCNQPQASHPPPLPSRRPAHPLYVQSEILQ